MTNTRKPYSKAVSLLLVLALMISVISASCITSGAAEADLADTSADNSFSNARQISVNSSYTDNLTSYKEVDCFKFSLSGNAKVSVNFNHTYMDTHEKYWIVKLFDSAYRELLDFRIRGDNAKAVSQSTGLASGTYYMKVMSVSSSFFDSRNYTFNIATTYSNYWEKELNNDHEHASKVVVNKNYSGSMMNHSDVDFYSFSLSSPAKTVIEFTHSFIDNVSKYWNVGVYSSDMTLIESFSIKGNIEKTKLPSIGLPAGSYYVKITAVSSTFYDPMDYSFVIGSAVSNYWEKEINSSFGNASTILLNSKYNGSMMSYKDVDYFKFSIASSAKVKILFGHELFDNGSAFWDICFYDSAYNQITSMSSVGKVTQTQSPYIGLDKGTYYIKISARSSSFYNGGDYSLTVSGSSVKDWETELNNDYATGDKINVNSQYYGSLSDYKDLDYYKFSLSSSGSVSITFNHNYINSKNKYWKINLYDTVGNNKISLGSVGNLTSTTCDTVSLSAGSYYVRIEGISSSYYDGGDYWFTVNGPAAVVNPTSVTLSSTSLSLSVGSSHTLTATVLPANATDKTVTWSSSNTSVAVVSNGKVTAKAAGAATITAKTSNGKTAACKVTVTAAVVNPTSVTLSSTSLSLSVGSSHTLTATVLPANATDKTVTWSSSNTSVAVVSNGKVTAKAAGAATITAKTSNGKTAACKVTVTAAVVNPTSVTLSSTSLSLSVGSSHTLTATVLPANATYKTVTWSSSNTSVAVVSNGKVTAKAAGAATVTAKTSNGKTAACKVTVTAAVVNPTSVTLSSTSLSLSVSSSHTLTATVLPANATYKTVTWSSSNTSVAVVSNGKVTAKAAGTATINAKTSNGKTAACKVKVDYPTDVPQITSLVCDENGINIKWSPIDGAAGYRVYYKTSSGEWKRFANDVISGTTKLDTGVVYNRSETYTVRALDSAGNTISGFNPDGWSVVYKVDVPQITSLISDENGINIKWNPVNGVSTYRVYYMTSSGDWKRFASDVTGTTKLDTGVVYNRSETYTVRALNVKGEVMSGFKTDGWTTSYKTETPQITSLISDENGINIKWNPVYGVSSYRVYYMTSSGDWKRFASDVTGTTKLDTGVVYNRSETYTVRALDKNGEVISGFKSDGWTTSYKTKTPEITSLKNTANGIQITWNKIPGVSTYRVYYKNSAGEWKRFNTDTQGFSRMDTGVVVGRAETYTVRALNTKGDPISGYNSDGWTITYSNSK